MVMLIPHRTGLSQIHGLGLFTTQPIEPGMMLWRFDPAIDGRCLLASLEEAEALEALHYGYIIRPADRFPKLLRRLPRAAGRWQWPRHGGGQEPVGPTRQSF